MDARIPIDVNASWRRDTASAAQLATLRRWGLPTPAGMTKGEAQQAIATASAARRAR